MVDGMAVVEQALDRAAELAPVGVQEGDVVRAGVAGRGWVPPALSRVFGPMWWW